MRIDNPTIEGGITLPATSSGHFSGSYEGDGSELTGVAPLAGAGVVVTGTTVSIGQDVATTSSVTFNEIGASNVTLTGTITAATGTFVYQIFESSSTIITSGSNVFGNDANDIQQITGSLTQSGSMDVVGQISASGVGLFSGLGVGTAASSSVGAILATNDIVAFASSDERLKENVVLIEGALDKVKAMRGVEFDWIANLEIHPNEGHDLGVIAQEVEAVKELSARVKELENK